MLDGKQGKGKALAAQVLISVGESLDAERLVPITRAHVSLSAQGADIWFAEKMAAAGAVCAVPPTVNPGYSLDFFSKCSMLSAEAEKNMRRTEDAYRRLGAKLTYCCTPYLNDNIPAHGEIVSFSETNATIYVNSVIGAKTNRESAATALCAAITGFTPEYGLLLEENRFADTVVEVDAEMTDDFSYSLLGLMGQKIGTGIPVFCGLPVKITTEQLINLGTQLNVSGSFGLFHIPGVTPDSVTLRDALGNKKPKKTVLITAEDLDTARRQHVLSDGEAVDFVMLGCPHYTYKQILEISSLLDDSTCSIPVYILTSRCTKAVAKQNGILDRLSQKNVWLIADTCVDEVPVWGILSGKTGVSDSPKCSYYMAAFHVTIKVMDAGSCIRHAIRQ